VNGTELHYVSAGSKGSPVLLVHGFPESWWAFHKLIPLLSRSHRVFAVDRAASAIRLRQLRGIPAQLQRTISQL
jgi:pimeloyl-ACP methyl ester carboxylesterase